ncbi:hypothetical protein RBU49_06575 [Clostridium sp. MB40-C1]|uniref:hypothetical protein n=1 Tax=Clostridium sp. MB40-C1 TaxID=3070996 RepID=UPI0027E20EC8|nr:hypothetical protein [Clostridium sp. MB40-C1]WMJ81907.1 hypothetical protein RBU49_06575 [Clostridium sp. MB40-C1]
MYFRNLYDMYDLDELDEFDELDQFDDFYDDECTHCPFSHMHRQYPIMPPPMPPSGGPGGAQGGPPSGPPPSTIPQTKGGMQTKAVDPGAIRNCLYRFVYIWPRRGRPFWAWLVFVGRRSVAGWRWNGFRWVYFGMDLREIQSFVCM